MTIARVTIVLPCLNEGAGLRSLACDLATAFADFPQLRITALFVDDGSTDDTWQVIRELAQREWGLRVRGVRLRGHQGKAAAQAAGMREAVPAADYVAVMDSDGQHDVAWLPAMVQRSIKAGTPVVASRTDYHRNVVARVGTAGLSLAARALGVAFDPSLSEFMVLPSSVARALTASSRLGLLPLVPLLQALHVELAEEQVRVLPRNGADTRTRWGLADLWHKAIMHLLSDPWSMLPRITLLIAGLLLVLGGYGLLVGVWSIIQGTFLGIGSVLMAMVIVFGALAALTCVTLGVAVVSYQSSASLAVQLGVDEEVG